MGELLIVLLILTFAESNGDFRGLLTDELESRDEVAKECRIEQDYRKFDADVCDQALQNFEDTVKSGILYDEDSLRDFIEAELRRRLIESL